MTKRALLLKTDSENTIYRIKIRLQEGRTAEFNYSDRVMAREHYEQLSFHGVIGGVAIREINLEEIHSGS